MTTATATAPAGTAGRKLTVVTPDGKTTTFGNKAGEFVVILAPNGGNWNGDQFGISVSKTREAAMKRGESRCRDEGRAYFDVIEIVANY